MNLCVFFTFILQFLSYIQAESSPTYIINKSSKHRIRRDTVRSESRKWSGGVIPYVFGSNAGYQTKTAFRAAIAEIERVSCVRFVPRRFQTDYVRVLTGEGCYSIIGRDGGMQDLSLGLGCYRKGIALHETMHLIGFFHEQSRLDRNNHVRVFYNNVVSASRRQFRMYKPSEGNTLNEPYDADSIMHYSNYAFSENGRETITFIKDETKKLGQRDRLSEIDIRQLNKLYRCYDKSHLNKKTELKNPSNGTDIEIDTCRDDPWSLFSGQCLFHSFMGDCYHSPQRMSLLCPLTCGYCRPTCVDTSEYCNFFSFYGYCLNNDVVKKRCKKTCKLCRTAQ